MTQNVWEQEAVKDLVQLEEGEFNLCDFALFLSVMKNETAHRHIRTQFRNRNAERYGKR